MTGKEFQQLLSSQPDSAEGTRMYRLGHTLRRRFIQALKEESPRGESPGHGHTERVNRLLALWLDLQGAVREAAGPRTDPWRSGDERVARLWERITRPENERALEEWMFQVPSGESELWAQEALLECRRRRHQAGKDPGI